MPKMIIISTISNPNDLLKWISERLYNLGSQAMSSRV